MYSGDEFYGDEVTSGPILPPKPKRIWPEPESCWWCEDWTDGFDPEPCPRHQGDE